MVNVNKKMAMIDVREAVQRALDSEESRPAGEVGRVEWFLDALRDQGFKVVPLEPPERPE